MKTEEEIKPTGESRQIERREPASLRELDAAVALKVLGWTIAPEGDLWRVSRTGEYINSWCVDSPNLADLDDDVDDRVYGRYAMPRYSADIAAAMEVVEAFIAKGGRVSLRGGISELMDEDVPPGYWQAHFFRYINECKPGTRFSFTVNAATLPEAICRAALEAALALVDGEATEEGDDV